MVKFVGSINSGLKKCFFNEKAAFAGEKVQILCSGSFSCEQIIHEHTKELSSNEVSLISVLLGDVIKNNPLRKIELINTEVDFLDEYINKDNLTNLAVVLFIYSLGQFANPNNFYKLARWENTIKDYKKIIEFNKNLIVEQFIDKNINIKEFYVEDATKLVDRLDEDTIVVSFFPTYSGGYEKMYGFIDKCVKWDNPPYEIIDDRGYYDFCLKLARRKKFVIMTDREFPELKEFMCYYVEGANGLKPTFIYSNVMKEKRYIAQTETCKKKNYPLIDNEHDINENSKIEIMKVDQSIFNYYRNLFIGKDKVRIFGSGDCFLWFVDKKLFGFSIYKLDPAKENLMLLSDFITPSSKYKRLSKLMIMVARSVEIKRILETKYKKSLKNIKTIVYTKEPVSMKYRGEYEKVLVKPAADGNNAITYSAPLGQLTIKGELKKWIVKHKLKK